CLSMSLSSTLHHTPVPPSTPVCFFLIPPRPPTSTLFPYTTLFRSQATGTYQFQLLDTTSAPMKGPADSGALDSSNDTNLLGFNAQAGDHLVQSGTSTPASENARWHTLGPAGEQIWASSLEKLDPPPPEVTSSLRH